MDHHHRAQLAHRIHLALMRELGQGIDAKRMLQSALYARDVLLVCQAYPDSELQSLGRQFSLVTAAAEAEAEAAQPMRAGGASRWPHDSSGFGLSNPAASGHVSDFGFIDPAREVRQGQRRWLAPSTWFAR